MVFRKWRILLQNSPSIPLSVFDKVTYHTHIRLLIYRLSSSTNHPMQQIELGLQRALSEYREWADRLGRKWRKVILSCFLKCTKVKLVEASVDSKLDGLMPLKPSSILLSLHPSLKDVEELVQVQLTRFTCGSLVIGFTAHHLVADGQSTSTFLVAWGKAARGLDISPLPFHDRTIFKPRKPPIFEFEHRGVEFKSKVVKDFHNYNNCLDNNFADDIVIHKVHFTLAFLSKLKFRASPPSSTNNKPYSTFECLVAIKPYSTFECLVAHLWRSITKARGLGRFETTSVRISVNGRNRMSPPVPNEYNRMSPPVPNDYFGNLVLWAFPSSRVKELVNEPLSHAAKLIHDAILKVNNNYFKSFIDFATHKAENEEEELVPTAEMNKSALCPNLEVDSWLRFPFYDLDFGGGCPYLFMPSYFPTEGMLFLLPSFIGDGSIDAYVPLFQDNAATFKEVVYSLE
ncbi:agmatine coumaroyltransferase-2-like [Jatropha curcas]|uniref:agmatine coumaroyltransferase-2-like n=1 Tax=Jatropha curcas TaxID=180498 RepID=UPI001893963E|nr:agmatine coumaroyltransferase-2-like [Jatropha curcas]